MTMPSLGTVDDVRGLRDALTAWIGDDRAEPTILGSILAGYGLTTTERARTDGAVAYRGRELFRRMGLLGASGDGVTFTAVEVAREIAAVVLGPSAPGGICVLCGSGVLIATGTHVDVHAQPCLGRAPEPAAPDEVALRVQAVIDQFAEHPEGFAGDVVAALRAARFVVPATDPVTAQDRLTALLAAHVPDEDTNECQGEACDFEIWDLELPERLAAFAAHQGQVIASAHLLRTTQTDSAELARQVATIATEFEENPASSVDVVAALRVILRTQLSVS